MKILYAFLITAFALLTGAAVAQTNNVTYINKNGKEVPAAEAYYFTLKEVNESGGGTKTRFLVKDSTKVSQTTYSDIDGGKYNSGVADGPYYEWHENGKLKLQTAYRNDTLAGEYKSWYESGKLHYVRKYKGRLPQDTLQAYYESGALRRIEIYENSTGKMASGKLFNEAGEEMKFFPMEQMPAFPGGENVMLKWLAMNIRYPKAARKADAQGLVVVSFTVGKNGQIAEAEVIKGFHPDADDEALRVVNKMPKWKPGLLEGEPVAVRYTLPVRFTIR